MDPESVVLTYAVYLNADKISKDVTFREAIAIANALILTRLMTEISPVPFADYKIISGDGCNEFDYLGNPINKPKPASALSSDVQSILRKLIVDDEGLSMKELSYLADLNVISDREVFQYSFLLTEKKQKNILMKTVNKIFTKEGIETLKSALYRESL